MNVGNFSELSENFLKTDEISFRDHFVIIKQKKHNHIDFTNFWKLFGEFSVIFRQTVGDSYLNKYLTILVQYVSQVYLSKHMKNYILLGDFF